MLTHEPLKLLDQFKIPHLDKGGDWITISCPFHQDGDDLTKCHGGVHRQSGSFKCFKCSAPGNIISVIATKMNVPPDIVIAHSDNILGTQTKNKYDPALVAQCNVELQANTEMLTKLACKHGITIDSVIKYNLGYYHPLKRILIPVYNDREELLFTKLYKYDPAANEVKILQQKGVKHSIYLYPKVKNENRIYITEGEFKAVILNQYGFPACASTGGAGTFPQEWGSLFKDKEVIIIYDNDEAGKKGARKLCLILYPYTKKIKNILLSELDPIPDGKDINDYFVKLSKSAEDFTKLVESSAWFAPEKYNNVNLEEEHNDPIELILSRSSRAEFYGKLISTTATVSAKDTSPFIVPKKAIVRCNRDKDYCLYCPVYNKQEQTVIDIPADSSSILELINKGDEGHKEILKERAFVHPKCNACSFKSVESYNVEELRLIPQIAIGHGDEEQCTRKAYYVGHGIAANSSYALTARVCVEPNDSHATLVIFDQKPVQDDINNFKTELNLGAFSPDEMTVESIEAKLKEIYADLSTNVTRIYLRDDLHLFYDLIYHTALMIPFQGRDIKGWGDALVIGDSGQGKSECSSRLMGHYKCGERVDTKRASVAGIVGGLQETAKRWFITWGTIPLNDRRLVILEEIKGMGVPELSKMTDMRSSGIAELIKIERAKTYARTRLIWISNPRSDSKLSAYNYGVDAVKELIGSLEDIRRFDMVMAVASGEVPIDIVNKRHEETVEHKYTSELCQALIGYAWSRVPGDIVISVETEQEILDAAMRMGATYSSSCPIVEPSDQRIKLARLSVALAIRTYSVKDGRVIVLPCHVKVVERFLDRIYKSKSLGYYEYSIAQKHEDVIHDTGDIEERLKDLPNAKDTVRGIIECELIRPEDIMNYTEWDDEPASEFIGFLTRKNCLKRSRKGGYRKTSAFIDILKKVDRMEIVSETYREKLAKGDI